MPDITFNDTRKNTNASDIKDLIAIIDCLWRAWTMKGQAPAHELADTSFQPTENSLLHHRIRSLNTMALELLRRDDFLQVLYKEDIPPGKLYITKGALSGVSSTKDIRMLQDAQHSLLESQTTKQCISALIEATSTFQDLHPYHSELALANAITCYLGGTVIALRTRADLSRAIVSLEEKVAELVVDASDPVDPVREKPDLMIALHSIDDLKKKTIRYVAELDPRLRPSPCSQLGHNLRLARQALLKLSGRQELQDFCQRSDLDPWRLSFSSDGNLQAARVDNNPPLEIPGAQLSSHSLSEIIGTLRTLSRQLHTDLSSDGTMRLSSLLDYYSIAHPIHLPGWGTDESLEQLETQLKQQLTRRRKKPENTYRLNSLVHRTLPPEISKHLVDALWSVYDNNQATRADLMKPDFDGPSNSQLQKEWERAQLILFGLYRTPDFWRLTRRWNLSINSLLITKGSISLSEIDNKSRRTTFLPKDFNDESLKKQLKLLIRLANRMHTVTFRPRPSLYSALVFHYRQPHTGTSPFSLEQSRLTKWETLAIINALLQQHDELSASSYYLGEKRDLEEIRTLLPTVKDTASYRYRPSTGTLLAKKTSQALKDFLTLLPKLSPANAPGASFFYCSVDGESGAFTIKHSHDLDWSFDGSSLNDNMQKDALESLKSASSSSLSLCSDGKIGLQEAAGYYLQALPSTPPDALLKAIETQIGRVGCGLRRDFIDASKLLNQDENVTLRNVVSSFLKKNNCATTLFEFLGNQILGEDNLSWRDTDRWLYFLYKMISSTAAYTLTERILKSLHWYSSSRRPGSVVANASLLIHALLLDLDPPSSKVNKKLLGYYMNKEQNNGKSYSDIYIDFKNHVRSLGHLSAEAVDMICLFVANRIAPELLTCDSSIKHGGLLITTEYVSSVYLAEALAAGSSQDKTTNELLSLADELRMEPADSETEKFIIQQQWLPALLWTKFRKGKVSFSESSLDEQLAKDALTAFEERKIQVKQALVDVKRQIPDRMSIVRAEIQRVFPRYPGVFATEEWNTSNICLYQSHETIHAYPFHEVYASEALTEIIEDWSLAVAEPPLGQYSAELKQANNLRKDAYNQIKKRAAELADVNALFEQQFDDYTRTLSTAYSVLTEEALFQLPERMINAIKRRDFEIFTLRTAAPELEAQQESPRLTNCLRGRFGVLLKIKEHKTTVYFQLLPLQGLCLALPAEVQIPVGGRLVERRVRTAKGAATIWVREGTPLPVDWHAYLMGTSPNAGASSSLIVEPLVHTSLAQQGPGDDSSPFIPITDALVNNLLLGDKETLKQLSWGETSLEKDRKKGLLSNTVDILVPFVENIRSLINSKPAFDPNNFSSAAFWLYAEAILLAIPFSKNLSKLLTGSRSIKPSMLAEVSLRSTLEALNPASGFISSIKLVSLVSSKGYKLSQRELLKQYRRFRLSSAGWYCQSGVALLRQRFVSLLVPSAGGIEHRSLYQLMVRSTGSGTGCYLVDPATLAAYGPLLERKGIYDAAGVMSNVLVKSQSLLPGSLASKVLTSGKSVTRLHEDDEPAAHDELLNIVSPPA